jgi:hypothetical protein
MLRVPIWFPQTRFGLVATIVAVGAILGADLGLYNLMSRSSDAAVPFLIGLLAAFPVGTWLAVRLERRRFVQIMEGEVAALEAALVDAPSDVRRIVKSAVARLATLTDEGAAALARQQDAAGFGEGQRAKVLAVAVQRTGRLAAVEAALALGTRLAARHRWAAQQAVAYNLAAATVIDGLDARWREALHLPAYIPAADDMLSTPRP